jgi:hypothetical protein
MINGHCETKLKAVKTGMVSVIAVLVSRAKQSREKRVCIRFDQNLKSLVPMNAAIAILFSDLFCQIKKVCNTCSV